MAKFYGLRWFQKSTVLVDISTNSDFFEKIRKSYVGMVCRPFEPARIPGSIGTEIDHAGTHGFREDSDVGSTHANGCGYLVLLL